MDDETVKGPIYSNEDISKPGPGNKAVPTVKRQPMSGERLQDLARCATAITASMGAYNVSVRERCLVRSLVEMLL